jgi:3-hydroxy acid dehydrogenase / malonic semialdehyde reductase
MYNTALVTGASRGIGEAIVRSFINRGMDVHALALADDDLDRIATSTGAHAVGLDIRDTAALVAAIGDTPFDVVVNNAGVLPQLQHFAENSAASVDLLVDINLRAALHVTRLVLPGMIERDRGHIFFTGSISGKHPSANAAAYGGTKAALHAFAEGLRCDLLGSNIRVTVLMPGRVQTRLYDEIFGSGKAASAALYDDFDAIQPADIASVVNAALDLPPNVDLTTIEILPTKQIFGGSTIARTPK